MILPGKFQARREFRLLLSGNRLRVDALRLRIGFSKPVCPSRWPRGISIAVSEPNCPSQPVSDSLPGLKTLHSEPAGPSELALWLNFGISEPKLPSCTPIQGPPGLKIALPDPARPFPVPLARVAGPEQERAALSAVADSGKPQSSPALRLRLSLHKVRLRRPLRPLPLSGAGAKPARTRKPCA